MHHQNAAMLYYAKDHALRQPFGKVLSSIEQFLLLASDVSRSPIAADIRRSENVPNRDGHQAVRSESMTLKRGFDFAHRVDGVLDQVRERCSDPDCSFGVRWVPNFQGPLLSSFEMLGIDAQARQEGGAFAHFIQISGSGAKSDTPNWAMLHLALPFVFDSKAFREFVDSANEALCFKLSPNSFRQLVRTKIGGFKVAKVGALAFKAGV